jgi:hypothetical protein
MKLSYNIIHLLLLATPLIRVQPAHAGGKVHVAGKSKGRRLKKGDDPKGNDPKPPPKR